MEMSDGLNVIAWRSIFGTMADWWRGEYLVAGCKQTIMNPLFGGNN